MCYPIDIDLAMDVHAERTHTLEIENRLALSAAATRSTARARRWRR